MLRSFMDSTKQYTRISVSMADVGTARLPLLLDSIDKRSREVFDSTKFRVMMTGTSITFLEGSRFIINGLKESIMWAFVLIAICMLYLFRSFRILFCSLIPNIIPCCHRRNHGLGGSSAETVYRFDFQRCARYRHRHHHPIPGQLPPGSSVYKHDVEATVRSTVSQTGLSIIYTAMVPTAGFIILRQQVRGTFALGWLTSVTLLTSTITNPVLLPVLLLLVQPRRTGRQ